MFLMLGDLDPLEEAGLPKNRLKALEYITSVGSNEFTQDDLARDLDIPQSTAQKYTRELEEAGIIEQKNSKNWSKKKKYAPTFRVFGAEIPSWEGFRISAFQKGPHHFSVSRFSKVGRDSPPPQYLERVEHTFPELSAKQRENLTWLISDVFHPAISGVLKTDILEGEAPELSKISEEVKKMRARAISMATIFLWTLRSAEYSRVRKHNEETLERFLEKEKFQPLAEGIISEEGTVVTILPKGPNAEYEVLKTSLERIKSDPEAERIILLNEEGDEIWAITRNRERMPYTLRKAAARIFSIEELEERIEEMALKRFFDCEDPRQKLKENFENLNCHIYPERPDEEKLRKIRTKLAEEAKADPDKTVLGLYSGLEEEKIIAVAEKTGEKDIPEEINGIEVVEATPKQVLRENVLSFLEIAMRSREEAASLLQDLDMDRSAWFTTDNYKKAEGQKEKLKKKVENGKGDVAFIADVARRKVHVFTSKREKYEELKERGYPGIAVTFVRTQSTSAEN